MTRRAELSPTQVGLHDFGRRRTPGLRREEVALLAGVGVSWYTWIEQGRAENVSEDVLDAIGRALLLDESQHAYLRRLAGIECRFEAPTETPPLVHLRHVIDAWSPNPAYIADRWWNVVVANEAAHSLLDLEDGRTNIILDFFTRDRTRTHYPCWEDTARAVVAQFRSQTARYADDEEIHALVSELRRRSKHFAQLWNRREVLDDLRIPESMIHPELGEIRFTRTTLQFPEHTALHLTLFLPEPDSGTERARRRPVA